MDKLTEKERAEIAEKVKKANPKAVEVRVDNKGNATVIYKDGSENSISKDKLVYKLNKVEVPDTNKNIQKQNSGSKTTKKSSNVKTGVASLTGVTTSLLLATGSLFISKKKKRLR